MIFIKWHEEWFNPFRGGRTPSSDRLVYAEMQKGNDSMILYLSVSTDLDDFEIDYIEVKLDTGKTVFLDWDESEIAGSDDGFDARYKGVYFDEEYANGKLSSLHGMQIDHIGISTESESDSDIVITEMIFEDAGEQYTPKHLLPYVISMED